MKRTLKFKMKGKSVVITATSVKCNDLVITQELIPLLMSARKMCVIGQDPVLRMLNEFVCKLDVQDIRLTEEKELNYIVPAYILEEEMMMEQQAA